MHGGYAGIWDVKCVRGWVGKQGKVITAEIKTTVNLFTSVYIYTVYTLCTIFIARLKSYSGASHIRLELSFIVSTGWRHSPCGLVTGAIIIISMSNKSLPKWVVCASNTEQE